ncbi:LysR family transcriptional regulator [Staphylococcus massiliensis]|uniref:LysR family transcriptional regulator n=1 Tax=Staphylococcus massiliensis S46 TaxID=1229783 RepID=K9AMP9_9STAP|nr:LysR family transcriptional regulator [Staphylococcus massiliensis]EKU48599.1 LysR family transcriptional regulator [Staphylococcus massiliensis S46]MCG3400245.1 LysR family transcriptional regulator [Staphylococcus massiliensis]MCG3401875.1 LysR family transcriptional regulator [Staphylococcus massiliensis]MCG3413128.1 LysR family transcriptional regulator [Staphylococcus massiliensis]PNZ98460.1 LysR family transcriptional regulator [Staphylococcus massiliensis CCUG 55927]
MKIDDYRLLLTLDETKTLRKAAEKLYISQPAVTQRLKAIEQHFGVEIFIRTKKQLITTTEGTLIIDHAKDVLKRERLFHDKMQAYIGEVNGTISIGCSSLVGQTILPKVLNQFTTQFPDVEIKLQVGSSEHIKRHQNDYHVMIIRGNKMLNFNNDHLFDDNHYFIYPTDKKDEIHKLPFIEFQADPIYINQIKNWYSMYMAQDYYAMITVDQVATCKELLLSGVGVTILPEIMLKDLSDSRFSFVKVDLERVPLIRSTYMSYDQSMRQLPQVASFIDLLKKSVRRDPQND